MNTSIRTIFAVAASFVAGALVLAPFRSVAGPQPTAAGQLSGQVAVIPSMSEEFVVVHGNKVSLYDIVYSAHKKQLVLIDTKPVP